MLVLSLAIGEELAIGDDVRVMLTSILRPYKGDPSQLAEPKARIGVSAPAHVPIHRQEVADEIRRRGRSNRARRPRRPSSAGR